MRHQHNQVKMSVFPNINRLSENRVSVRISTATVQNQVWCVEILTPWRQAIPEVFAHGN